MPPCPPYRTAGAFDTGVFAPCCVTSHSRPTFSVISMRPSGRNAMRHGRLNSATCVNVNGKLDSGAFSPAFTCACAAVHRHERDSAARDNAFIRSSGLGFSPCPSLRDRRGATPVHRFEVEVELADALPLEGFGAHV